MRVEPISATEPVSPPPAKYRLLTMQAPGIAGSRSQPSVAVILLPSGRMSSVAASLSEKISNSVPRFWRTSAIFARYCAPSRQACGPVVTSACAAMITGASRCPAASTMLAMSIGLKSCGATKVSPRLSSCARLAASSRVRPVSTRATRVRTPPALVTASTAAL